jgi:DNA-binding beta-propeller fold protein YncE
MTSTAAGEVIFGSSSEPTIFRAPAGTTIAEPWIHLKSEESSSGVLADTASNILWVCVQIPNGQPQAAASSGRPPPSHSVLRAFNLRSGQVRGSFPLPGATSLCNDITIARDRTVYITDTPNGRVLRLKSRAGQLEIWLEKAELKGADGITFLADRLYVNNVQTGQIYRIPIAGNGDAGDPVQIQLSQALKGPDGMRSAGDKMYVAENGAGRVSELTIEGDQARVRVIKDGYQAPTAVSPTGNTLWVGESKFNYRRDPELRGQDPGPFKAYALPLP